MRVLLLLGKTVDQDRVTALLGDHDVETARHAALTHGVRRLEQRAADAVVLAPDPADATWPRAVQRIRDAHGTAVIALLPGPDGVETALAAGVFDAFVLDTAGPGDLARCCRHLARERDLNARLARGRVLFDWVEETARLGSWEMDARGRTTWSAGARRILESADHVLTGNFESIRDRVHAADLEIFEQANRATFSQGWPLDFEYRVARDDGGVRHLRLHRRVEHGPGGEVSRAFGMLRDITPEREFEDVLFRRDAVLQVVGACAAGFLRESDWERDIDARLADLGRTMEVTRAYVFRALPDRPGGDARGMVGEWAAPDVPRLRGGRELHIRSMNILYKRLLPLMLEHKVVACHNRELHAEERALLERTGARSVMLVPVFAGGEWWGLLGLSEHRAERDWLPAEIEAMTLMADILGSAVVRNHMEKELVEAHRLARDASLAKSRFLANMSHEIRTPIGGILGMTGMLADAELPADLREHVDMIREAARSLLDIVNDVLDLSRVEARKLELVAADFDPRALLDRTLAAFAAEARQKGVALELRVDDAVDELLNGDAHRLAQVVRNLVGNALKFTTRGFVRVDVDLREAGPGRRRLGFTVRDSGEGIPAEIQATIFDAFVQGDSSARKRYQGTGLGLAICRELVGLMDGEIRVRSEPGRGSVFSFTARFGEARGETAPQKPAPSPPAPDRLHVLLVDDNPLNQRFLTHFLNREGHRVTTAGTGREALDALRRLGRDVDLVLMDIQMPEMDGIEATRVVRAGDGVAFDPAVPILALTAYAMKGDREQMLAAGMNGYVSKPVDLDVLAGAMAGALAGRRGRIADAAPPADGFDMDGLASRYRGETGLLREILALFLDEAAEKLALLDRGLADRDDATVRAAVHAMTNLAGHVLAMDLVRESRRLEKQCVEHGADGGRDDLRRLGERFAGLAAAVRRYADSL